MRVLVKVFFVKVFLSLAFATGCISGTTEKGTPIYVNSQTHHFISDNLINKLRVAYNLNRFPNEKQKTSIAPLRNPRSNGKRDIGNLRSKREAENSDEQETLDGFSNYPQESYKNYEIALSIIAIVFLFVIACVVIFYYWSKRYCSTFC